MAEPPPPAAAVAAFPNIPLVELPRQEVDRQFYDVRLLASGWYTKVFSARHQRAAERVVLKCVHKGTTTVHDFLREFHYNYFLSPHPNVLNSFHLPFVTASSYVFAQELAPAGDLSQLVRRGGVGEAATKRVAGQVAAALAFMHSKDLVHRDVTLDNILAFDPELRLLKLGDFGATQRAGAAVTRAGLPAATAPPEVRAAGEGGAYHAHASQDAWQLGVLVVACLTGALPWAAAEASDRQYSAWAAWVRRTSPRLPPRFRGFTPRLLRLLRRLLHPDPEKRAGVEEVEEAVGGPWVAVDMDPFEGELDERLLEVPEGCSLLHKVERKLARLVLCYLRAARPKARSKAKKRVRFALNLEEAREQDTEGEEEEEEEEWPREGEWGWEWGEDWEDGFLDYPAP